MTTNRSSIIRIWNQYWPHRKIIIWITGVVTLLAVIISLLLPNWYKSTAVLLPPTSQGLPLGMMQFAGEFGLGSFLGGDSEHNRIISILKSYTLLETVAKRYNFMQRYDMDNLEKTIKQLRSNIDISIEKESQIAVSFWDKNQEEVADITRKKS